MYTQQVRFMFQSIKNWQLFRTFNNMNHKIFQYNKIISVEYPRIILCALYIRKLNLQHLEPGLHFKEHEGL